MKKAFVLGLLLFLLSFKQAQAITNPISSANNKFGIHIIHPCDLADAARLVNSSGGDWGYVTLIIREDERDIALWQEVFDSMAKLHLIPIIRLATTQNSHSWQKPNIKNIDDWVNFLNSLEWVTKNRYLVIFNEPNHAKEWGGKVNPEEYAQILRVFSEKLKASSENFFILPAALDASAPNSISSMDEALFLQRMFVKDPDIFNYIDGWNSHSYPNPGFAGSELASGKGTIKTFEWELGFLKELGINKSWPVFITETGWANDQVNNLSAKYVFAFENVWTSQNLVTITPFLLSHPDKPFDAFSWKAKDGNFFDYFYSVQAIPKIKGKPLLDETRQVVNSVPNICPFYPNMSAYY
jgi:hypothetical protein